MIKIFTTIFLGILLSGIWFGLRMVLELLSNATKIEFISRFSTVFATIVPTMIIVRYSNLELWNVKNILNWQSWIIILITVVVTALIVSINKSSAMPSGMELLWYALDGVMMEFP